MADLVAYVKSRWLTVLVAAVLYALGTLTGAGVVAYVTQRASADTCAQAVSEVQDLHDDLAERDTEVSKLNEEVRDLRASDAQKDAVIRDLQVSIHESRDILKKIQARLSAPAPEVSHDDRPGLRRPRPDRGPER